MSAISGHLRNPKLCALIDDKWRQAKLPFDDLEIALDLLPDPEQDEDQKECAADLEKRWTEARFIYLTIKFLNFENLDLKFLKYFLESSKF